jgi:hypothetical protein
MSDHINSMPKYVVSTTLKDPEWNITQVIDGDVVAAITRRKEGIAHPDQNLGLSVCGFTPVEAIARVNSHDGGAWPVCVDT